MKALAKLLRKAAQKIDPTVYKITQFVAPELTAADIFGGDSQYELTDWIILSGDRLNQEQIRANGLHGSGRESFIGIRGGYDETVDAVAITVYEPIAPGQWKTHSATANSEGVIIHEWPIFDENPQDFKRLDYSADRAQVRSFLQPRPGEIEPELTGWTADGKEL